MSSNPKVANQYNNSKQRSQIDYRDASIQIFLSSILYRPIPLLPSPRITVCHDNLSFVYLPQEKKWVQK